MAGSGPSYNRRMKRSLAFALVLATASPALADPDPTAVPQSATMDRQSDRSSVTLDASMTFWDSIDVLGSQTDIFGLAFILHGQYMAPVGGGAAGAGGYLTVPIGYGSTSTTLGDMELSSDSDTGAGNIELGGVYAQEVGGGSLIGRAGVALPTASSDQGPAASAFARITDVVLFPDNTWCLRFSGSFQARSGAAFLRVDAGIDFPFADNDNQTQFNDEDPLVRLNAGGGVVAGGVALMAELATLATTGDVQDGQDRFIHTVAAAVRLLDAPVQPMASVVIPLDDGISDFIDFSVLFGVSAPLDGLEEL